MEQRKFLDTIRERIKDIKDRDLTIIKNHYVYLLDNHLSTLKDCIWLMTIKKELHNRKKSKAVGKTTEQKNKRTV